MRIALLTFCFLAGCGSVFGSRSLYSTKGFAGREQRLCGTTSYKIATNVPASERQDIHDAFRYWDDMSPWQLFVFDGLTEESPEANTKTSTIVVGYGQTSVSVEYEGKVAYDIYATTYRRYSSSEGCMFGVSIKLNSSFGELNKTVRQTVLRHEVGHALGLNHSGWDDELMFYAVDIKDPIREVSKFEWEAFKEFY